MFEEAEKNGLRFECTGCRQCCGGSPGYVWLSRLDIDGLSSSLGLSVDEFIGDYCKKVRTETGYAVSLRETSDYSCIFLGAQGCNVYAHRPIQCSSYPFWDEILVSAAIWKREGESCPGIDEGRLHEPSEIMEKIILRRSNPRLEVSS